MTSDEEAAARDQVLYGCGFLVDGVRVAPQRVKVLAVRVPVPARTWRDDAAIQFAIGLAWGFLLGGVVAWAYL